MIEKSTCHHRGHYCHVIDNRGDMSISAAGVSESQQRKKLTLDESLTNMTFSSSSEEEEDGDDVTELNKLPHSMYSYIVSCNITVILL